MDRLRCHPQNNMRGAKKKSFGRLPSRVLRNVLLIVYRLVEPEVP